jgi:hypothetical protein
MAFAVLSSKAIQIWQSDDDPPAVYFERYFSKNVEGVPFDEFMQVYQEFIDALEQRLVREEKNWRPGK